MLDDLGVLQRALADVMSEISENTYCAGWMSDLEFELWEALNRADGTDVGYRLTAGEIERLRQLSEMCGGWIVWKSGRCQTFVPFTEWKSRFAAWSSRQSLP